MTPNLGQGGGQALEDAIVLAAAVSRTPDVATALADYDHQRRARTQAMALAATRQLRLGQQLQPVLAVIGTVRLRELDVADVDRALAAVAVSRSSSTVAMAHLALTWAITRAQAKDLVLRNVSALTGTPPGREGRPSRSMSLVQATAVTTAARAAGPRIRAYVMLSLCTGVRTVGSAGAAVGACRLRRPRQRAAAVGERLGVAVGAGQRRHQDPQVTADPRPARLAVTALQALHEESRPQPGELVFCTATGEPLDAANVRRSFRAVCRASGIGPEWTPRELRHTFVSLMSDSDVAVEEIARLVGHASSKVTETVYRHQLRPVMTIGAEKMDALLAGT